MRRREFITFVGGAAVATWPLAARAQQAARVPTIGWLGGSTPLAMSQWVAAFIQRLRDLGWLEGHNLKIEYRWAEGRSERFTEIATEFARLKVDVIVTTSTPGTVAAKHATSVIPIVFATLGDPVGTGLVESLARPGGNVTGASGMTPDVVSKRIQLLREIVPALRRLGVLAVAARPNVVLEMRELQATAKTNGLEVVISEVRQAGDIAGAFEALTGRAEALYVTTDPLVTANRIQINTLAVSTRLPTMHGLREYVEAGGLVSYGASFTECFRRGAVMVDKILRGAKPADIPVEQPTKFELVINAITAKALGLKIPPTVLVLADEIIE